MGGVGIRIAQEEGERHRGPGLGVVVGLCEELDHIVASDSGSDERVVSFFCVFALLL